MKLSCSTNSPGAYADSAGSLEGPDERSALVLLHGCGALRICNCSRASFTPRRMSARRSGSLGPARASWIEQARPARSEQPSVLGREPPRSTGHRSTPVLPVAGLAATVGLAGRRPQPRRLGGRGHLRSDHDCGTGTRPLLLPRRPAGPGRLGDARSGHARRRRRGAGRGLVRRARAGHDAGVARGARARRWTRSTDGSRGAHGRRAAGRAVRRRGRRVPDPHPQRVCRPLGRRVGAGDRRGPLRVPRGRMAAAVDA